MSKYFLSFFIVVFINATCFAQEVAIKNLLCESVNTQLAIDINQPRLSWQLQSQQRHILQAAYQILVASSPEKLNNNIGNLWDSKKQFSDNSILIAYKGITLKSTQACYWKVKVWTTNDIETEWSSTASWSMGLLNKTDWQAKWIGYEGIFSPAEKPDDRFTRVVARYVRKDFKVSHSIKKAIAYISGVGLYELYLNGNKIGNQVLAPGPTDYSKRVFYNTFDVTEQLKKGDNAVGVILGNGRFVAIRQHLEDTTNNCVNYGFPKLLMQLQILMKMAVPNW